MSNQQGIDQQFEQSAKDQDWQFFLLWKNTKEWSALPPEAAVEVRCNALLLIL